MSNQILDIKSIVERKKREEEQLLKQQEIEQERIAQSLSRISKIKDTFRNFVNEEVPEIYDFYELDEDSVIIRVFDYRGELVVVQAEQDEHVHLSPPSARSARSRSCTRRHERCRSSRRRIRPASAGRRSRTPVPARYHSRTRTPPTASTT